MSLNDEDRQWLELMLHQLANELGLVVDEVEWDDQADPLNPRLAVEVDGVRKIHQLWRDHVRDAQTTREVYDRLQIKLRSFLLESFGPSHNKIGFGHPKRV